MSNKKRWRITLLGCVQGVGFRPFVYRLAQQYKLTGQILNTLSGVSIDVQGNVETLSDFQCDLKEKKPEKALISEMSVEELPLVESKEFKISVSQEKDQTHLALLPDTAICKECLQEFSDPKNRRFQYPFLHCMSCGPRFSLFLRMPFDRNHTSMIDFSMCQHCKNEYEDPSNRRFYSQTNCCPACGPKLKLFDSNHHLLAEENSAIEAAIDLLKKGKIIALKNTGGFLLLVDSANESAIHCLRKRKRRPKKPFALLSSLLDAKKIAWIDEVEESLLTSLASPIVLLKKKIPLLPSIAFDSPYYGIMLPHNALHHLILNDFNRPLIATSGNLSGQPICIDEEEALNQLGTIADAFLTHNRRITHRLDDSIMQVISGKPMLIRRARGFIPYAIESSQIPHPLFATGGHLKNSFAFANNHQIYLSQHIGDLDSKEACLAYEKEVESWKILLNTTPKEGVGDLHPTYSTTQYLQERSFSSFFIQHHKAHVYSGMLDNRLDFPFFSIVWDGTGFGEDGTIWGGEAFIATQKGLNRFATLSPFRLVGSEKAVKEPRRSLLGIMHSLFGSKTPFLNSFSSEEFKILLAALDKKIQAPLCHSMGRLFDAVSALLNCCFISSFEGEAALSLEVLAINASHTSLIYSFPLKRSTPYFIEWEFAIRKMIQDKADGRSLNEIAWAFHSGLADTIVELAKRARLKKVLLTGGCMQNKLLSEIVIFRLKKEGFTPYWHSQIPPNDGGLAAGQILALFENI